MSMEKRNTVEDTRTPCTRGEVTGQDCQCPVCMSRLKKSANDNRARGINDTDELAKEF